MISVRMMKVACALLLALSVFMAGVPLDAFAPGFTVARVVL
jgi:hypothetical protein